MITKKEMFETIKHILYYRLDEIGTCLEVYKELRDDEDEQDTIVEYCLDVVE